MVSFTLALTDLMIGSALLLLSAFWHSARGAVLAPPRTGVATYPRRAAIGIPSDLDKRTGSANYLLSAVALRFAVPFFLRKQ